MKVKMNARMNRPGHRHNRGDVVDFDDATANDLINRGFADPMQSSPVPKVEKPKAIFKPVAKDEQE